jgi:hypothetical protein
MGFKRIRGQQIWCPCGARMVLYAPLEGEACSSRIKHGFSYSLRQSLRGATGKWFGRVGWGQGAWAKGGGRQTNAKAFVRHSAVPCSAVRCFEAFCSALRCRTAPYGARSVCREVFVWSRLCTRRTAHLTLLSRVGAKPALDASGCAERGSHSGL